MTSPPAEPSTAAEVELEAPAAPGKRRILADLTPLRVSAPYRRAWFGSSVSVTGNQLTAVAVPLQVYALTRSSFDVGLVGLVQFVPLVTLGLVGGAVVDAVDRRKLMLLTTPLLAMLSAGLCAAAALHNRHVWLLYVLVGAQAGVSSADSAARGAIIPRLIGKDLLPAANALGQLSFNAAFTGGPLLAGLLVGSVGYAWVYGIDAVSFLAVIYAVVRLPPLPPEGGAARAGVASVVEGLRYLKPRKNLLMTFLVDIDAMLFGMPRALYPAIAVAWYHGGAATAGLLYAAPSVGALLGAVGSGWIGNVRRQGLGIAVAITVWGASIAAFGLVRVLAVGLVLLALAGAADMVSAVLRSTMMQVSTPDSLRGRLQGVFIVVVTGGPRLGDLESGTAASLFGLEASVVSGGVACLVGLAALLARFPRFLRYDAHAPVA